MVDRVDKVIFAVAKVISLALFFMVGFEWGRFGFKSSLVLWIMIITWTGMVERLKFIAKKRDKEKGLKENG